MRKLSRVLIFLAGLVLVAVVGCSASVSQAPEVSQEAESELAAEAVVRACSEECDQFTVYVYDELFTHDTLLGEEDPMPQSTIEQITERLGDVTFVGQEETDALFGEDALVDSGRGVLLSIGPIERLAQGVVGIEVGLVTARDGGRGQVVQFQWSGEEWLPATSEDTGVTVTSWVS